MPVRQRQEIQEVLYRSIELKAEDWAGNANAALIGVKLTRFDLALESDLDLHGL